MSGTTKDMKTATCAATGIPEKCQAACDTPCREHNPDHPYIKRFVGCGHGVLFRDYCRECEIIALIQEMKAAQRALVRTRARLQILGRLA